MEHRVSHPLIPSLICYEEEIIMETRLQQRREDRKENLVEEERLRRALRIRLEKRISTWSKSLIKMITLIYKSLLKQIEILMKIYTSKKQLDESKSLRRLKMKVQNLIILRYRRKF